MYKITKEFSFDMAHLLENHEGKCKNLHGHTYKLFVTLCSNEIKNDMILDFADLKKNVSEVIDNMDHAFGYNSNSSKEYVIEIANILKKNGLKTYDFKTRTTCEQMSKHIYYLLKEKFEKMNIKILEVSLYEGVGSFATYSEN